MICPVCEQTKWKDITHLRLRKLDEKGKKIDFSICEGCGFIGYPSRCQSEEELKKYYRDNYRPGPQANSLFTGERKLQYHAFFLTPLFEEWKKVGLINPVVGEIGSAHGMFLNWLKGCVPGAEVHGTELTETYRRVAFQEYGLKLTDDLPNKKYDLLVSYHVLEHQSNPHIKLKEYADMLSPNGIMYLSCPVWFRDAHNSGAGGFDIEYYWHPDHINCWGEEHLEHILAKTGLEILMKDTEVYGNTYILKRGSTAVSTQEFDYKKYLEKAEKLFSMWIHLQENNTAMAIEIWPNCPAAWALHYELNKAQLHKDKAVLDKFLNDMTTSCPNSADALIFKADVLTRYERYEEAHNTFNLALRKKTNNPNILLGIANCYRRRAMKEKDQAKKVALLKESINLGRMVMAISTEIMPQALSWIYHDEALLEVPNLD